MRFLLAVVVCSSLLLTPGGVAQQQQKPADDISPTIQVEVNLVNLLCSVREKHGAWITNLTKDDFTIAEDGRTQEIKYFTRETDLPLTIGLLVDVSGSQRNLIEIERRAASAFFSAVLHKKDMAFLISFGSETELLQDFTGSPRLLQAGLEQLRENSAVGGLHPGPVPTASQARGTVLYDAVYLAATDRLAREVGRKAIVLITDGVDQGSRLSINQAIEAAQKSGRGDLRNLLRRSQRVLRTRIFWIVRRRRGVRAEEDGGRDGRPGVSRRSQEHAGDGVRSTAAGTAQPVQHRLFVDQ